MQGQGLRFRSPQRLRYSWEFASLKSSGGRAFSRTMIMNWRRSSDRSIARLGVVVSKRVGNSVARSRARRLLREAFRNHQHQFTQPCDIVLVARKMISDARLADVIRDFSRLLDQAGLRHSQL